MKEIATKELTKLLGEQMNILDHLVFDILVKGIINAPEDEKIVWAAFVSIFKEVKDTNPNEYKRFQYYFSDDDINHREVVIVLLDTLTNKTDEVERLILLLRSFDT